VVLLTRDILYDVVCEVFNNMRTSDNDVIIFALRADKGQGAQHTHPFNDRLSGTTRVSRYQKGKTNLNFTEARDSEWQ